VIIIIATQGCGVGGKMSTPTQRNCTISTGMSLK